MAIVMKSTEEESRENLRSGRRSISKGHELDEGDAWRVQLAIGMEGCAWRTILHKKLIFV